MVYEIVINHFKPKNSRKCHFFAKLLYLCIQNCNGNEEIYDSTVATDA